MELKKPSTKGFSGLALTQLMKASKISNCFQVTLLHPRTNLKDICKNIKISDIQKGKIHKVWLLIKMTRNENKEKNYNLYHGLNDCASPYSYVNALISNVIVFGPLGS